MPAMAESSAAARKHFTEAAEAYASLVRQIGPEQWHGPGLGEWDLRALVGHTSRAMITVDTYLDRPAQTEAVASPSAYVARGRALADPGAVAARGRQAGEALGEDPVGTVDALTAKVARRLERDDDPLIETIAGGMRLSAYLPTRTFELVVHSLDIARAAGLDIPQFSVELLTEVAALAATTAVLAGQGAAVILALTGRADLPDGFSVV
jgi:uncharacterized protein (TIGR03083 family)